MIKKEKNFLYLTLTAMPASPFLPLLPGFPSAPLKQNAYMKYVEEATTNDLLSK